MKGAVEGIILMWRNISLGADNGGRGLQIVPEWKGELVERNAEKDKKELSHVEESFGALAFPISLQGQNIEFYTFCLPAYISRFYFHWFSSSMLYIRTLFFLFFFI